MFAQMFSLSGEKLLKWNLIKQATAYIFPSKIPSKQKNEVVLSAPYT